MEDDKSWFTLTEPIELCLLVLLEALSREKEAPPQWARCRNGVRKRFGLSARAFFLSSLSPLLGFRNGVTELVTTERQPS